MGYANAEAAIGGWYSEVSCCASFPGCETGPCTTGHLTAMVWKGVRELGCAVSTQSIYLCRYRSGDMLSSQTANMGG